MSDRNILVLNSGSSSIKFTVFSFPDLAKILSGKVDHIGMDGMYVTFTAASANTERRDVSPDTDPLKLLTETLGAHVPEDSLTAIGHRIVHGGTKYREPVLIDTSVIADLESLAPFAPRHLPAQIALLREFTSHFPSTPQYGCFDTSFFKDLPRMAQMLPIPRAYEEKGIRRYGFHGLSYEYLMQHLRELNEPVDTQKIILAHLGSGASITAVQNGVPVETTMGFTPNSGIPMGTRSGDLDPGLFEYFTQKEGLTPEEFDHMVNTESGMLGVSGTTADMEVLLKNAEKDAHAEEAVQFFCYQVQKSIGALAAVMGGLDVLVFTGGIGEKSAEIRRRITEKLEHLGVHLNIITNTAGKNCISDKESRVTLYMIPTDEELMIARHVKELSSRSD